MENGTPADGDEQSTSSDTELVEEYEDEMKKRLDIQNDLKELSRQIDEVRDEMIHPNVVQMVLEHTGLSEVRAVDLVETMQEVDRRMRDDDSM